MDSESNMATKQTSAVKLRVDYFWLSVALLSVVSSYMVLDMYVLPALPFTLMWIAPLYTECTDMLLMFSVGRMCLPVEAVKTLPR